mmetsp:Transcript_6457/g.19005  ORF Transcript_6457/g.19005 Transcript_6457/m.19005 type:complete len:323 (-) Transcript_6457:120-1088(-)
MFKLHYFLYDNTIEILTVHSPNSGRDNYPLLLKRARLPKPSGGFWHWTDLNIGCIVNAYSRMIKLIDADRATRSFYSQEGIRLGPQIAPPINDHPVPLERTPPPYSGFGSEEDSLTSCTGSLVQKAPARQHGEDGILRYQAAFACPKPEDRGRLFVLVYYSTELALMIREPPRRNSGVVGGNFLAKMQLKHHNGKLVTAADIVIGATLNLASHTFIILDADEATLKYMEERPNQFPYSDWQAVLKLLETYAASPKSNVCSAAYDLLHKGAIEFDQFESILRGIVPDGIKDAPVKQCAVTLWRHYANDGRLPIADIPAFLTRP